MLLSMPFVRQSFVRSALLAIALLSACTSARAQATYRVFVGGKPAGEARITQRMLEDGGKTVGLILTIRRGDERVVVKSWTTFASSGEPLRAIQSVYPFGKPATREVIVNFDLKGANVVEKKHAVPRSLNVPLDTGRSRANRAEFWFIRDTPTKGESCKIYTFNLDSLQWELTETTYIGPAKKGFHVRMDRDGRLVDTVIDSSGYPLLIEDSKGMSFVRQ